MKVTTTTGQVVKANPQRNNLILSVSSSGTVYLDPREEVLDDNTNLARLALTTSVLINLRGYTGELYCKGSTDDEILHVWES